MPKKIEMTPEQASLFNQMKKLSKRANQRIVRLERLTGVEEPFAVKQLADYLSQETLNAWTKKGRSAVKKGLTNLQMKSIIKALNRFLQEETSTQKGVKKYAKKLGQQTPLNLASTYYKAEKNYKWIFSYMTESDFWDFAREIVKNNDNFEDFSFKIEPYLEEKRLDSNYTFDLQNLFNFIQGVKV